MLAASLGQPQHHRNLTIFPILAERDRDLPFVLMADALASGHLTIGEKDGGQVPFLQARNAGPDPVLILDGEQLIGARQNRMTNRSIILGPKSTTEIPVSCMEQGRWHFVGDHFSPAPQHAPSRVRRRARETEARASYDAERRGPENRSSYRALSQAQGMVWDEIRAMGEKLGGASPTAAMDALYEGRRQDMESWLDAYALQPGQIGLLALTGAGPLGLDAVGSSRLFARLHRRILTGYVMDALEAGPGGRGPGPRSEAEAFVDAVLMAERAPSESVGMGEYRILRGSVLGGELADRDLLVHLSAFPAGNEGRAQGDSRHRERPEPDHTPLGPIAPPSRRRHRF